MSNSITTNQEDGLHIPSDSWTIPKATSLQEVKRIEGTPFDIVRREEGYFLTMGSYRLTNPMETEEEIYKYMDGEKWNLIMQMIVIVHKKSKEISEIIVEEK